MTRKIMPRAMRKTHKIQARPASPTELYILLEEVLGKK